MKVKDFIEKVNSSEHKALFEIEDEYSVDLLKEGCDLDGHRWFSYATNYYKCEDGIAGVTGAFQSFSELQMWSDIAADNGYCEAFEAEEFTTISYRPKKK